MLECVGALVHDRSEIGNKFWPAQAACLWWPQQWRQEHHHKHTQHLLWELSMIVSWKDSQFAQWTRMMIPRAAPGCWRLSDDNCEEEEEEGDINPARYKMCSTLLDSVVGQWPKSSIQGSLCIFAPRLLCVPRLSCALCHVVICWECWRVETSQCQCSGRWGEGLAAGDAELATGDNGHHTLGWPWDDKLVD